MGLYGIDVNSTSTESSGTSSTATSTPSTAPCVAPSPTANITRSASAPAGPRPTVSNAENNQQISSGTTPRPRLKRNQSRTEAFKKFVDFFILFISFYYNFSINSRVMYSKLGTEIEFLRFGLCLYNR